MKYGLFFCIGAMFVTAVFGLYENQSYAISAGLFMLAVLSAAGMFFTEKYRQNEDKNSYEWRMKGVQGMTMVGAFLSLYWPVDVYYNVSLLLCLIFHCCLRKYARI